MEAWASVAMAMGDPDKNYPSVSSAEPLIGLASATEYGRDLPGLATKIHKVLKMLRPRTPASPGHALPQAGASPTSSFSLVLLLSYHVLPHTVHIVFIQVSKVREKLTVRVIVKVNAKINKQNNVYPKLE